MEGCGKTADLCGGLQVSTPHCASAYLAKHFLVGNFDCSPAAAAGECASSSSDTEWRSAVPHCSGDSAKCDGSCGDPAEAWDRRR